MQLLDSVQIDQALARLVDEIVKAVPDNELLGLIGIRSRGEILAQRIAKMLTARGVALEMGTLDITLYRDDLEHRGYQQPVVRTTEIDFDVNDRLIVLVDDVLFTGRSVRAALSVLHDLGRPRVIRLAVLIDRGCRELPISADFVGEYVESPRDTRVQVYLEEADDRNEVVLERT